MGIKLRYDGLVTWGDVPGRGNMAKPAPREQILRDLDRLPPDLQTEAVELVRCLGALRGASVEDLLALGGTLDKESAREIRQAVEEHCERADPSAW